MSGFINNVSMGPISRISPPRAPSPDCIALSHIAPPGVTSHDSPHLASPRLASPRLALPSPRIALTSHRPQLVSRPSPRVAPHRVAPHRVASSHTPSPKPARHYCSHRHQAAHSKKLVEGWDMSLFVVNFPLFFFTSELNVAFRMNEVSERTIFIE